ncbi:hypothetical protein D3C84_940600 [compost metagenome]
MGDARDFQRSAGIEALDLAAVDRGPRNGGEQHAVEMHVSPINRLTPHNVFTVDGNARR